MIAAFSRAIAAIVGPSRSMWSRSTLVIAATPPSQAWVASSRPPRPTSTRATSSPASREVTEHDRRQQLELGRDPRGAGRPGRRAGSTSATRRVNVSASIGPAIDLDALAIGDEVRLRRLADAEPGRPQRAAGQRQHAALAVGPRRRARREPRAAGRRAARSRARVRPRPSRMPNRPRSARARSASSYVSTSGWLAHGVVRTHAGTVTPGSARPRRRRTG